MRDLYNIGLRGSLPKFIKAFLEPRRFKVKVGGSVSEENMQENGVPQGSVLSVTLFSIKINSLANFMPNDPNFIFSLYVDDLQIGYRHSNTAIIQQKLQSVLVALNNWSLENGFKFSLSKSKALHFTKNSRSSPPLLKIGTHSLEYVDTIKFLGLIWDPKLTWRPHIEDLRARCLKSMNLLKMTTSLKWGADQFCCLKIFHLFIRSKIDYGAPVYASACQTALQRLDPICSEALRLATGAFRSTPIKSLHILTGEMTLQERREYLSVRYGLKMKSSISNPAFQPTFDLQDELLFNNRQISKPFCIRLSEIKETYEIPDCPIKPEFSYTLSAVTLPTYKTKPIKLCLDLANNPKTTTPDMAFKQSFYNLLHRRFLNHLHIYTDGSKSVSGVGAAVVHGSTKIMASLPTQATIFTAEVYALQLAIDYIKRVDRGKFVIFTDSLSALRALSNIRNNHPYVRRLIHEIDHLNRQDALEIELCWVPSHVGILGNEAADTKAAEASMKRPEFIPIFYKDVYCSIKEKFKVKSNAAWQSSSQKLYEVKSTNKPWKTPPNTNRQHEVIVNRLRLGHTYLTHSYLMDASSHGQPPVCHFCNDALLSVKHLFLVCPQLAGCRCATIGGSNIVNFSLADVLGEEADYKKIIDFLNRIGVLSFI